MGSSPELHQEHFTVLSLSHLESLLLSHGMNVSEWGKDTAKSIEDLYSEIRHKESTIAFKEGEVHRETAHVALSIFYSDKTGLRLKLVEVKQVWHDGSSRERSRNLPQSLSEKLVVGEDPIVGALRGMKEELGINISSNLLVASEQKTSTQPSESYPGLLSRYQIFPFEVTLPEEFFKSEGYIEDDGKKHTYFEWVKV